jgi:phage terminase large subunit GpA-like protein
MPSLMIKCPSTKKLVNTGMNTDRASFERSDYRNNTVPCPHCGHAHTWSKQDVAPETWQQH